LNFFDFVFYLLLGMGVLILASVVNSFIGGRRRSAWMTLRVYLVVIAIYAAFLIATTLALPIQVLTANETQYAGDWAIAVSSVRRTPHDLDEDYELDFRLSNRGAKAIRGDSRLAVYLLTEDGTRYNPLPEPSTPPFEVEIKPGKSVTTTRRFVLPTNLNRVQLVVTRTGFRSGWFIIGRHPLDGRTVVQLQ
jgi:hypothetical protein